ncbi:unnamed protein product [Psylliodes chrysocephalus]|uniref:Juvenile hormone acid methyltransferase n=1 Tax=Psylliodes chrysocephalus TaxID=3402493 RepID=A0A9P0GG64_9CUCU|nr:unnamed protein product [Psylliodes chrysocephala]
MAMTLPELYNQSNDITIKSTQEHIKKHRNLIKWKDGESILDIGIGDGNCSVLCLKPILPENYKEFFAMDVSNLMLEYAKGNINFPRTHFVQFDMASEDIQDCLLERFDHIFSFYCIHMIRNTSQVFRNIYKMAKPNGQIFLTIMEYSCADASFHELNQHPKWGKYGQKMTVSPFYYSSSPEDAYRKLLGDAGFVNYTLKTEKVSYDWDNEETWKNFCISINPLISKIPIEEVEEYQNDYVETMRKYFNFYEDKNKQVINIKYNMFIIVGNKTVFSKE